MWFFFFFQAEDGIRDLYVTGVQTCALPIFDGAVEEARLVDVAHGLGVAEAGDGPHLGVRKAPQTPDCGAKGRLPVTEIRAETDERPGHPRSLVPAGVRLCTGIVDPTLMPSPASLSRRFYEPSGVAARCRFLLPRGWFRA